MMSFQSSTNRSPVEEDFEPSSEDPLSYPSSSSEASSTITAARNGSSNSVYVTANQTPMASPDIESGTASSVPKKEEEDATFSPVIAPTKDDQMSCNPSGKFQMNPKAPVFVPSQEDPLVGAPNLRDYVYHDSARRNSGQETDDTLTQTAIAPPSRVQLFGSGHGIFFEPSTGMFVGDGAPRKSPYRADGTLPSKPDLVTDVLTRMHYPEPTEDVLHIQPKRQVTERMADFGKEGPIQTFYADGPVPQGNQQWTRVEVRRDEGRNVPLDCRMPNRDQMERGQSVPSGPGYVTDEMEANLKRLMGITDGEL